MAPIGPGDVRERRVTGNSRRGDCAADPQVGRRATHADAARKGPTGGWVERRDGGDGAARQDARIRASYAIGSFRSGRRGRA
jgi:hypothetical protein